MNGIEVALQGRSAGPAVIRESKSGKPWAQLSIAISGEGDSETEWVNVAAFGRLAEQLADQVEKGDRIYAEGSLRISRWKDQSTGEWRAKLNVAAWRVEVLGKIGKRRPERKSRRRRRQQPEEQPEPGSTRTFDDPVPF